MVFSQSSARWLANTVEECTSSKGSKNFYKSYRDGMRALFAPPLKWFSALLRSNWIWWQWALRSSSDPKRNERGGGGLEIPLKGNETCSTYVWLGKQEASIGTTHGQGNKQGKGVGRQEISYAEVVMGGAGKWTAFLGGSSHSLVQLQKEKDNRGRVTKSGRGTIPEKGVAKGLFGLK